MSKTRRLPTPGHAVIAESLQKFYKDQILCDVTLAVTCTNHHKHHQQQRETDDVTFIECHKVVLAAGSGYFKKIFVKKAHANIVDVTQLSDIQHAELKLIVDSLYSRRVAVTASNVSVLYQHANKWDIPFIVKECQSFLQNKMTTDVAFEVLQNSSFDRVKSEAKACIYETMRAIKDGGSWSGVSRSTLVNLLELDILDDLTSDEMFTIITKWIDANAGEDENRDELYDLIDYESLSTDFLCEVVLCHPQMQEPSYAEKIKMAIVKKLLNQEDGAQTLDETPSTSSSTSSASQTQIEEIFEPVMAQKSLNAESSTESNEESPNVLLSLDTKHNLVFLDQEGFICRFTEFPGEWEQIGRYPFCNESSICSLGDRLIILGNVHRPDVVNLLALSPSFNITALPRFPAHLHSSGMVTRSSSEVLVVGGDNIPYTGGKQRHQHRMSNRAYNLNMEEEDATWEKLPTFPMVVRQAVCVCMDDMVFMLGGQIQGQNTSIVQVFSFDTQSWHHWKHRELPMPCSSAESGGVVYRDQAYVFTPEACIKYDERIKSWTAYPYPRVGTGIKPLVYGDQIIAIVSLSRDRKCLMAYETDTNYWYDTHVCIDKVHKNWLYVL